MSSLPSVSPVPSVLPGTMTVAVTRTRQPPLLPLPVSERFVPGQRVRFRAELVERWLELNPLDERATMRGTVVRHTAYYVEVVWAGVDYVEPVHAAALEALPPLTD